jgi:hypothetical protein
VLGIIALAIIQVASNTELTRALTSMNLTAILGAPRVQ